MIDMPMPSFSITNKPSSGTSLYHTCRSVLDKLALVEGMTYYLDFENLSLITSTTGSSGNLSNDPLTKLWELCRRGAPLATLFNALNPSEPLKLDFTQNHQLNECKKTVYHFIVACRNQLKFKEEDVFTLSDLYKDNTNGFVKVVVNTIDLILQLLEEKGIICTKDSANRNSLNAPKDTRDKVVHELLETERKYVQDLEILQNYMRELQIQEVLNPDTIHYLFGNLNTLVDFQRRFLIYLEEIGEKPAEEQNFGSLFSQMEDQFTVYEPYCANYFSAQDLVVQEAPKLQKLAGILNPVYELPSMLIKPVQRICKYPLLLNQLIKSMKPDWPHYEDMEEGLESVKRVTEKVNETQRKHENIQVVDDLKRRVDEMRTAQIDSFGSLLLHDKLVMQQSDESDKEMYIFFFERTMLICKESKDATKNKSAKSIKKKRRGSLQPKGLIVMSKILSVRNTSTGEGNWYLRVDWKDGEVHTVTLKFRNEEQVKLWESTLKRRIATTYQQQQQQLSASPRLRSQSSPNIHHNTTGSMEEAPQLPFNSRTLYQTPPSPLDSPIRDSNISYRTTNSNTSRISDLSNQQVPLSPVSSMSGCVKIKLNYNDGIYVVMCSSEVLYYELMDKVERKIRLVANLLPNDVLRLRYQDEDGDLITINSDDDVQMAFESRGNLNTINLFVSV
ncbi:hypothetical protein MUCCIDRAFT_171764 [Mucor lusitanicus CBS 277.49]|uniref:DH domain-containing protein n=1 Tax=Mucor lusitanicus CBS 277.49 TaxID=747725 RepID=A0A168LA91_MUCCL|nr:hypothetical protein MUCCIDRAFT_171764 [Mucor lusitanicus CBS 277.49]